MWRRIMLTCSDTCSTLACPSTLPVFDLFPRANHDSTPGSRALNPLRLSRITCGSDRSDRLLSATKSILPGGAAASIASRNSSNRTPKLGSCQPTRGRARRHGHRAAGAEQIAEGIGEQGGFGERPDEYEVDVGRELADEVLEAGIADEGDLVSLVLAPHADDLRHDAREVGVHDARVQGARGTARDEIDDADAKLTHSPPQAW